MKRISLVFIFLLFIVFGVHAQRTTIYIDPLSDYKTALELYNKEKFGSAQKLFTKVYKNAANKHSDIVLNAQYYEAVCTYELFNNDAELLLTKFISENTENPKTKKAEFYLANFLYRKKRYKEAVKHFEKLTPLDVEEEQLPEYYFKSGYCYFEKQDYDKAKPNFYEIKDGNSKYSTAATYYYSHISYVQKNYQTALEGFLKLENNEAYNKIAPYYVAQIYFLQKKYDQVVTYAPKLIEDSAYSRAQKFELLKIMGYSHYYAKRYKEAQPYLQEYVDTLKDVSREDFFVLGNAYYRTNSFAEAQFYLTQVRIDRDSLTQITCYLLGDCFVKNNKKKLARGAFEKAAKLDFDKDIQEDGLFNFAKLSYELDINPFNESIKAFEKYLNNYPSSPKKDEAYSYLVNVYLTTKNYDAALQSINNISEKSKELQYAYQRVAYYKAIQLFNNSDYREAIAFFDKADTYLLDKNITALTTYWRGEAYYRMGNYAQAIEQYNKFIYMPTAITQDVFNTVHYNLGYASYQLVKYADAIQWFRKFIAYKDETNKKKLADANIRIADCYFINKNLENAIEYYSAAIELNQLEVDYALFQKAIASGVLTKYDVKSETLERLLKDFPTSKYIPEANYELANTYLTKGNNDLALTYFDRVTTTYTNSTYFKKALLKKGLIFYNGNKDEEALKIYKRIVADYPATPESKEALVGIKNILVDDGKANEYAEYVQQIPFANITLGELDSTTYEGAEKRYMKGDCENSINDFGTYLSKYPQGIFALNATYYKADCEYKLSKYDVALEDYKVIIGKPKNKYTEASLIKAARISNKKADMKNAINYYEQLESKADEANNIKEAKIQLMRNYFIVGNFENCKTYSAKVQLIEKVGEDIIEEAKLLNAQSNLYLKDTTAALSEFVALANSAKTEVATEAKYTAASLYFTKKDIAQAEKLVYEIINQVPSYDLWIAKSFILLADVFVAKKDRFSAKNTLQSIIDNSDNGELVKEAQTKLDKIIAIEKEEEIRRLANPLLQINVGNEPVDQQLLEEERPTEGGNNNE